MPVTAEGAEPLAAFPAMRTRDAAEAEFTVSQAYSPHRLEATESLDACLNVARSGGITIGWLRYGGRATLSAPPLLDAYHLNLTLRGSTRVRHGRRQAVTTAGTGGALLSPREPTTVEMSPDAAQFAVRLDRRALEGQLSALLHDAVTRPLRFDVEIDVRTPAGSGVMAAIGFLAGQLDLTGVLDDAAGSQLQSYVLTSLLLGVPNSYSERLTETSGPVERFALDEALDYIEEHSDRAVGLAELAAVAGVPAARLRAAFRQELGTTPRAYVRDVRLARARAELARSGGAPLREVARRCGYVDVRRFVADYAVRYGTPPASADD